MIAFAAATTAVAGLLQVKQIVDDINLTPRAQARATSRSPPPGSAADAAADRLRPPRRRAVAESANTDTMMLVRIDDSSSTINVLSVPRDLEVQLPERWHHEQAQRRLLDRRAEPADQDDAQAQVFPGLEVNHILDVNFGGFDGPGQRDRLRVHRRRPPLLQQHRADRLLEHRHPARLPEAVRRRRRSQFVRFRHTDSDIVRNARQQDFIRWAKEQYQRRQLLSKPRPSAADLRRAHPDRPRPAHRRRTDQPVRPGRIIGRPHDQADPVPRPVPTVRHRRAT